MSSAQDQPLRRASCGHYGPDVQVVGYEQCPTGAVAVILCQTCRQAQGLKPYAQRPFPEPVEFKVLCDA